MKNRSRNMVARLASTIGVTALALCMFNCGSEANPDATNAVFTPEEENPAELQTAETSEPLAVSEICRWRGTAPFCDGECHSNETERMRSSCNNLIPPYVFCGSVCVTGTKAYCCRPG